ncbi:MAG TPA: alpha-L-fucosidase C-terminal domain-containing protein, partial [Rhodanobacter sp.]|nr:alpha-L-fucosidase C-terminal domain-containing protein [Rhodanobacter sp.]
AQDVRFTTKDATLFAIALGRPDAPRLTVRSLASNATGSVERVELLGSPEPLRFKRDAQGLTLELPHSVPGEHAIAFRIMGRGLTAA